MSIILDALKKAEQERSQSDSQEKAPVYSSVIKTTNNKTSTIVIIFTFSMIGCAALLFVGYTKFYKKTNNQTITQNTPSIEVQKQTPPQKDITNLQGQAINFFKQGELLKSEEKFKQLIELAPSNHDAYNNLGLVLKKLGKREEAQKAYEKALEIEPSYPEALNNLGTIFLENGFLDKAMELLNQAISIDPNYAAPHFHLAIALEKQENKKDALFHFRQFLEIDNSIDPRLKGKVEMRIATLEAKLLKGR